MHPTRLVALALLATAPLLALEGKWTPDQLLAHDPEWLAAAGLEIAPEVLWNGESGLLRAAVQVDGCSAGVVSAEGLVLTNHHCAFGLLQQHSSPERDLITNGFLASSRDQELPGEGTRATVPWTFRDVTSEVEAVLRTETDDLARKRRLDRLSAEMVAACELAPSRRCELLRHDDGVRYVLAEAIEFPDVRLVWAPPRSIGEFGGEIDNWSWPRHTGDFAILRIWAAADGSPAPHAPTNRPWRPTHYFPISTEGVSQNSAVLLAGYPGLTFRSLVADEAAVEVDGRFATRARFYADWIGLMEAAGASDEVARIALASRLKTLANREKNARGQLEAITRLALLERRRALEAEVLAWAQHQAPEVIEAHGALVALAAEARSDLARDQILAQATAGPLALKVAIDLVRWSKERSKPDLDRRDGYRDRDRGPLEDSLRTAGKRLHLPTEAALLADLGRRAAQLPADRALGVLAGLEQPELASQVVSSSAVFDDEARLKMLDESPEQLAARGDALLQRALALENEMEAKRERDDRRQGAELRWRPTWRRGVALFLGRPLDPDANGSLRLSLARVVGYRPRDGLLATPQTTLGGVLEKHTGVEPFVVPPAVLTAAADPTSRGRWIDANLGDVPVNFLADGDTTGGSSGSPVLDGRGRLVGLNFDRVWENIANDFGYEPSIARNISVDVRYLLWILEAIHGTAAARLRTELLPSTESSPRSTG